MDFTTIHAHLSHLRAERLDAAVADLETAIAAGVVPNKLFTEAKDIMSRAAVEAAEAFLKLGPHDQGRDGQPHHQSDWWLGAYDCDAFVSGTHTLPTVLKRAQKRGLTEYANLITALLPLRELLETAKPLIKKRGELPVVKTAKQIADEADRMTCQCCGRGIFAATGTIAHHGYERPGHGWQTQSCFGAKRLPWEADRSAVADLIKFLKTSLANQIEGRDAVKNETAEVTRHYSVHVQGVRRGFGTRENRIARFTRNTFDAVVAETKGIFGGERPLTFDQCKAADLEGRNDHIAKTKADIIEFQKRHDGWKQTHKREGDQWVAL